MAAAAHVKIVKNVFQDNDILPASVRSMLIEGLDFVESPPNEFGLKFLNLVTIGLKETQEKTKEAYDSLKVKLSDGEMQFQVLQKALCDAKDALADADTAAKQKADENCTAIEKAKSSQLLHQQFEKSTQSKRNQWGALKSELAETKALADGPLKQLAEGLLSANELDAAIDLVQPFLDSHADKVIASASTPAFKVPVTERGSFDQATINEVVSCVQARIKELDEQVQASAEEESNLESELLGLWAIADVARDNMAKLQSEKQAAENNLKDAETTLKASHEAITKFETDIQPFKFEEVIAEDRIRSAKHALDAVQKIIAGCSDQENEKGGEMITDGSNSGTEVAA